MSPERNRSLRLEEVGGSTGKEDRIRRLLPVFESITFPPSRMKTLHDGKTIDVIDAFIQEELLAFPVGQHDDLLDAIARVLDPDIKHLLRFPESDMDRAQRISSRPTSYLPTDGNGRPMSHVERHRAKMAGRSSGGYRQPRARPKESGIWAKPGWK